MSGAELLSVAEMAEADRLAVASGLPSLTLMENAGAAVVDEVTKRWPNARVAVLCGPGNNGGDGYVAARLLKQRGSTVWVEALGDTSALTGDAAEMFKRWDGDTRPITRARKADCVVDALFGAWLSRPLDMNVCFIVQMLNESSVPVIAVDVPSGMHGDLGCTMDGPDGMCVRALATVTFFRKKPGHLLMPGRIYCGETIVADIWIPDSVLETIRPLMFENVPELWLSRFPWPRADAHKYDRGHTVVVSGPAHATGAARLAARGALRIGTGLVSVASPLNAVGINAAHLTAIMVKPFDGAKGLSALLADKRFNAVALGPGLGVGAETQDLVAAALGSGAAVVLDADALTSFVDNPKGLFTQLHANCVLTPHAGEFERIFPGVLKRTQTKLEAAREAAAQAGCVVLLKGPDTIIAAPDGRTAINANAPPFLATAGAGDVLAGMIAGLLAQGMNAFDAACAGTWLHGEAAKRFGLGLIAEDIPEQLPAVLQALR
ncbi:MAG: NAD(P)H-hydrate dehydratase [Alphaproteobacteria bacterium]|nr:NAD(P)H-hydrate dehydratase [Alphaproteobacteria bacterium]